MCTHTSVLAVWPCVAIGTETARRGRRGHSTPSSVLTGWTTGCSYEHRYVQWIYGSIFVYILLHLSSPLGQLQRAEDHELVTHVPSFLHAGLHSHNTAIYVRTVNTAIYVRTCFWICIYILCTYLCSRRILQGTHWDSHRGNNVICEHTLLHSHTQDSLQNNVNHSSVSAIHHGSMLLVVCAAMYTSVLAVISCVPTGTVTVNVGRWMIAGSSILTGWTTVCNIKHTCRLEKGDGRKKTSNQLQAWIHDLCSNAEFQPSEPQNWSCSFVSQVTFTSSQTRSAHTLQIQAVYTIHLRLAGSCNMLVARWAHHQSLDKGTARQRLQSSHLWPAHRRRWETKECDRFCGSVAETTRYSWVGQGYGLSCCSFSYCHLSPKLFLRSHRLYYSLQIRTSVRNVQSCECFMV